MGIFGKSDPDLSTPTDGGGEGGAGGQDLTGRARAKKAIKIAKENIRLRECKI